MKRIKFVQQIGYAGRCAREGCGKNTQYRVILGSWDVEAYVCTGDLAWAINLDVITQSVGESLGWRWGHSQPGTTIRASIPAQVIPEIGPIKRLKYDREVRVDSMWPLYFDGCDIPHYRPRED